MRWSRLDHQDSVRPRGSSAVAAILRLLLRLANILLALCGVAIMVYAVYMYGEVHRRPPPHQVPPPPETIAPPPVESSPPPPPTHIHPPEAPTIPPTAAALLSELASTSVETHTPMPWFIIAFGGAGLFTFITAATGLIGAARNSRAWLGVYSFLAITLLLAQAALALAFFADAEWQKRFPHDETGEAGKLRRWIEARMAVCQWVGLGVLLLQVLSVAMAFGLSAAQRRELQTESDEEEEVWGRRQPLLQPTSAAAATSSSGDVEAPAARTPAKDDPWSRRMRDKYGLDTSQFSYTPPSPATEGASSAAAPPAAGVETRTDESSSRCIIM